ncbi:MAG: Inhibitor of sigma-G Gin [Firmicutes bacterium ADurb.Bin456]|nr:MAG: Inhibitor of sigma-G Gin [Firmicutes bacterium ADurb.Bin456]
MISELTKCIFCLCTRQKSDEGLLVQGHYICPGCEARIIALTREDPDYDYCKCGLKKIWYCPSA